MSDEPSLLDQARAQFPVLNNEEIQYKFNPGGSDNMLESWQPGEPGDESYKRPAEFPIDKFGIEVFDPKTRPIDILGDVVSHRLINTDPKIKRSYADFTNSIEPWQENILHEQYQHAQQHEQEQRPFDQWKEMTGLPAYFRGYPFQQWGTDDEAKEYYTPGQLKHLDTMMDYLRGKPSAHYGDDLSDQQFTEQFNDTMARRKRDTIRKRRSEP